MPDMDTHDRRATCKEVQDQQLTRDDEIRAALVDAVSLRNFIPDPLRDAYGEPLLAEYHTDLRRYDKSAKRPV
jgi:hypothetical protein